MSGLPRPGQAAVPALRSQPAPMPLTGEALLAPSITRRLIEEFARLSVAPDTPVPELDLLTEREVDVLRLLASGLSTAEIADSLYIEQSTVKTHVTRLLSKLGLRDRTHAVVFAYECGLVRPRHGPRPH